MDQYFPKPYEPFGGDINIKVLLKWGSDDQTLDNFGKLFIKNIGFIK